MSSSASAPLRIFLAAICAVGASSTALAETLPVEGFYAARADVPAEIDILATEPFGGDWGYGLQASITDLLSQPVVADEPYFQVIPAALAQRERIFVVDPATEDEAEQRYIEVAGSDSGPDAVLRGAAHSSISDYSTSPKIRKECVLRDEDDECVEHEEIEIPCRQITVHYRASVTMVAADGSRLYHDDADLESSQTYCEDDHAAPDPDAMIGALAARYIDAVQSDLLPAFRKSDPRLLERRKGLTKQDRRTFKEALRLTKNDPFGACIKFRELEASNPEHVSVLFNIGLCHESEGELDRATTYYERALATEPDKNYPKAGLKRVESRERGEAQLAAKGLI
ncbi:hypothetical protein [Erythrobacter rubeus]|uniref:Tetratricopeptide repeat protein n=1 Tax=Erythrobacter rubeus TaxID=2760803 RepID=A0ABR8KRV6_9SPHN|nr:hypothetical protein [Erythrobacter rubeus]MBD2842152.1 hypothetical protein [Erythrobacter rubeus]